MDPMIHERHMPMRWWLRLEERSPPPDVAPLLDTLDARDRRAIVMRVMESRTLQETGDAIGVSRERARQIVRDAIRRLKCRIWSAR